MIEIRLGTEMYFKETVWKYNQDWLMRDCPTDGKELNISDVTKAMLEKLWRRFNSLYNDNDPANSLFWSLEENLEYERMWISIQMRMNEELWEGYSVTFLSILKGGIFPSLEEYEKAPIIYNSGGYYCDIVL